MRQMIIFAGLAVTTIGAVILIAEWAAKDKEKQGRVK